MTNERTLVIKGFTRVLHGSSSYLQCKKISGLNEDIHKVENMNEKL